MILAPSVIPYLPNLAGGLAIGLAAGDLRLGTGQVAGISGILRRAITGPDRGWRLAFLAGLILPGVAAIWLPAAPLTAGLATTPYWLLATAGLLVGLGTGLGNGCTSGHGICGLANFSPRSLAAVATFGVPMVLGMLLSQLRARHRR